jgi:mono/diheme cytochrome c family protein
MNVHPELKPEIDFKDLIRKPERLFGYAYMYFFGLLLVLGMIYAWNLNSIGKNAIAPVVLADSSAFVQDIPFKSPLSLPPVDVMKAGIVSDSLIARGRDVFRAICVSCHGENGLGDGLTAATLNPKPRNFHSLDGWKNGSKVSGIYKTLQEGIPGSGMASYNYLPPGDRLALAHYVRTFAAGQPTDSPQDLQALELSYQLSKGGMQAGQIPVKKAAQLAVDDGRPNVDRIASAVKRVQSAREGPGPEVLQRVMNDPTKILAGLKSRGSNVPTLADFIHLVTRDPNALGFKPSISRLSDQEWESLYGYLRDVVDSEGG